MLYIVLISPPPTPTEAEAVGGYRGGGREATRAPEAATAVQAPFEAERAASLAESFALVARGALAKAEAATALQAAFEAERAAAA